MWSCRLALRAWAENMESAEHAELKRMVAAWLRAGHACGVACEVRTAIPLWRADVAAWFMGPGEACVSSLSRREIEQATITSGTLWSETDPLLQLQVQSGAVDLFGQPAERPDASMVLRMMAKVTTALVECKVSRADFLSDGDDLDRAQREHRRLRDRMERMQSELVPRWEPHLQRRGETLFEQTDGWDTGRSRLQSVREARRDERLARLALQGRVKFDRMARWRLADRLYLCCPGGMVRAAEIPDHWGWIEVTRGALRLRRAATPLTSPAARRWRTVRGVIRSASRNP